MGCIEIRNEFSRLFRITTRFWGEPDDGVKVRHAEKWIPSMK